jgi:hypothetical protein
MHSLPRAGAADFRRGDADASGRLEITDAIAVLGFLFLGGREPACLDAADADDSGTLEITDPLRILVHLFLGGRSPQPPFEACGGDPTPDGLGCDRFPACPQVHEPPPAPQLEAPASPTAATRITLRGRAAAAHRIRVVGGAAPVETAADAAGAFTAEVELVLNRLNRLFASAIDDGENSSPPSSVEVIQDGEAPFLFIDQPADGAELALASLVVAGRVADVLSGFRGLEVSVNGQSANVAIGIGTNGTFERAGVALQLGDNIIEAVATDAVGNRATRRVRVRRIDVPAGAARIEAASGDAQQGSIHRFLAEPIVVALKDESGAPLAARGVDFEVTRSDGRLYADALGPGAGALRLRVQSDAQGLARAFWKLGGDAGCGNNRARAASAGVFGEALFCASAAPGPAAQINIGSGQNQRGEVGAPAAEALRAWVSDGCNGVAGVAVSFRVVRGGGKVDGQAVAVVETSATGHAAVEFVLGPEAGNQAVEADFLGNRGEPAVFTAYGLERDPGAPTRFSGIVLDNGNLPLEGATCVLRQKGGVAELARSGSDGRFVFESLDFSGAADLFVDGLGVSAAGGVPKPPGSYPGLRYETVIVANADNSLGTPVLLPSMDPRNARRYSTAADTELTVEGIEGLTMRIKAGSMTLPDGRPAPDGAIVSLNQVHHDDVPMPMPDGAAPPFAWTLQPAGARFEPPVEISYPNMSALPAGSIAYFLTFNHDTGRFEIVASGQVSADASVIRSDPGAGIRVAGWGCNCPPYSVTGSCDDQCEAGDGGGQADGENCDPCEEAKEFLKESCIGAPTAGKALSCQLACLAESACDDENPDWVRCTIIDFANTRRSGNLGPTQALCDLLPNLNLVAGMLEMGDVCFAIDGTAHLFNELVPSWTRKCNQIDDGEHNEFLFGELVPCLIVNPFISAAYTGIGVPMVPLIANIAREVIQSDCAAGGGGGAGAARIERPAREQLFIESLETLSSIRVRGGDRYFLAVGESVQLQVTRRNADGSSTDISAADSGTIYLPSTVALDRSRRQPVTITEDGLLTVHESPSAISALPYPLFVFVGNGDEPGVGQFAIVDDDADGDLLGDAYERRMGIDGPAADAQAEDTDGDGLRDLVEALLVLHPGEADSDGDGVDDGIEVSQGSDPRNPDSRLPSFRPPHLAPELAGAGAAVCGEPDTPALILVNGQVATANPDGSFRVDNVAAPDAFGPDGPGSTPDFQSDDFVRAVAVFTRGCKTYYAASAPFQFRQGETFRIDRMEVSETPPPVPQSIRIEGGEREIAAGEARQLRVIGTLIGGSEVQLNRRDQGTVYRTSSPDLAAVGPDGLLEARGRGTVFITASNSGASTVKRFDVRSGAVRIIVRGRITLEDGTPVEGAAVRALGESVQSEADGSFNIEIELEEGQSFTLAFTAVVDGRQFRGASEALVAREGAVFDLGDVRLRLRERLDLVFANPEVLIGDRSLEHIDVADIDGDGAVDIAFVHDADDESALVVLKNEGDGRFAAPAAFPIGPEEITLLQLGDVEGDGDIDAATLTSDNGPTQLSVLIQLEDGTFSSPASFDPGSDPEDIVIAPLDGDAFADVAIVNAGEEGSITLLFSLGDGTFRSGGAVPVDEAPQSLAAGDLDGDGDSDLLVGYSFSANVTRLLNDGDGGFGDALELDAGRDDVLALVFDADGDGDLDAAFAFRSGSELGVALNRGNGDFDPVRRFAAGRRPAFLRAADLDGDGDLDLASLGEEGQAAVLRNLGNGAFGDAAFAFGPRDARGFEVADTTGDGLPDLIAGKREGAINVLVNLGAGSFGDERRLESLEGSSSQALADFDGDGDLDIAAANGFPSRLHLFVNSGAGSFEESFAPPAASARFPSRLRAGDLDGDGFSDVIGFEPFTLPSHLFTHLNRGAAGFTDASLYERQDGRVVDLALEDLDGDGDLDAAAALQRDQDSAALLFLNDGRGTLLSSDPLPLPTLLPALELADLDGDGDVDLVAAGSAAQSAGGLVVIRLNAGSGVFAEDVEIAIGDQVEELVAADFDADGDVDLALGHHAPPRLSILTNDGGGGFAAEERPAAGDLRALVAGDADGDGDLDLLALFPESRSFAVLFQDQGGFESAQAFGAAEDANGLAAGDLDGDGDLDLAISHPLGVSLHLNRRQARLQSVAVSGAASLPDGSPAAGARVRAGARETTADANGRFSLTVEAFPGDRVALLAELEVAGRALAGSASVLVRFGRLAVELGAIRLRELFEGRLFDAPAFRLPSGAGVGRMTKADLDGDGDFDLVSPLAQLGAAVDDVAVFLNRGDGAFADIRAYPVGQGSRHAQAADLDGDGDADLAVVNNGDNSVSVLLNRGDGAFGDKADFAAGTSPSILALGEFTGDAAIDIAVTVVNFAAPLAILPNQGDGTFGAPQHPAAGDFRGFCAAADFDGDGDADLALRTDNTLGILRNLGGGSFAAFSGVPATDFFFDFVLGDIDGDEDIDILAPDSSDRVQIFKNDGAGRLAPPLAYAAGHLAAFLALEDFDGDGDLDLATANPINPRLETGAPAKPDLLIHLNAGGGVFAHAATLAAGYQRHGLIAGDLDGDGDADLAFGAEGEYLAVLANRGDGVFESGLGLSAGVQPVAAAAADLDGDGLLDLAVANQGICCQAAEQTLSVILNQGGGAFAPAVHFGRGSAARGIAAGDLDGDGDEDVVLSYLGSCCDFIDAGVQVLLNDGGAVFAIDRDYTTPARPFGLALGDLDGDGDLDIAAAGADFPAGALLLLNQGAGRFADAVRVASPDFGEHLALGDLDGDGDLDIAAAGSSSFPPGVRVALNLGAGAFGDFTLYPMGFVPDAVALGDLDGVPGPDIAASIGEGLATLSNGGRGVFLRLERHAPALQGLQGIALADFDLDGDLDAACTELGSTVAILQNDGLGAFEAEGRYFAGLQTARPIAADLDADGDLDLAAPQQALGRVLVYFNRRVR